MDDHRALVVDAEQPWEALAAELTAAAYRVAIRHAIGNKWLDLQLDLWRVLAETVKQWDAVYREPPGLVMSEPM
jgi:hypothetical protein